MLLCHYVAMSLSIDCKICEFVQRIFQVVSGVSECYVYSPSLLYIYAIGCLCSISLCSIKV